MIALSSIVYRADGIAIDTSTGLLPYMIIAGIVYVLFLIGHWILNN